MPHTCRYTDDKEKSKHKGVLCLIMHHSLKMYGIYPHIHNFGPTKRFMISFMLHWLIHQK